MSSRGYFLGKNSLNYTSQKHLNKSLTGFSHENYYRFFYRFANDIFCQPGRRTAKKSGETHQEKVNERVNRRFDQGVDKGLDEVEKGVGDAVEGDENNPEGGPPADGSTAPTGTAVSNNPDTDATATGDFQVNTKFDYVPGELVMVSDNFEGDAIGDFPARWNTDGTGEVVTFGASGDKWFQMKSGSDYIPDLPNELPEEYTIEFDLAARGLDKKTSSSTLLEVILDDNNVFENGRNRASVRIPFCLYHHIGFYVRNAVDGKAVIKNSVEGDIRKQVMNQPHISIAVNKTRFRTVGE